MSTERDLIAEALPGYDLGRELGRGAFGVVLAAEHRELGRPVAIKQLYPAIATNPEVLSRFHAEARFLAGLNHPHIVPIYDYVEFQGLCLLVMEQLAGGEITMRSALGKRDMEDACGAVLSVCVALQYAHSRGVLHRDIKPANLLVSDDSVVKVSDFGIAKVIGGGGRTHKTRTGDFLGTPAYMSPEQAAGRELTPQTDVYAAGIMLYEFISGQLPYADEGNALSVLYRHVHEDAEPLRDVAPHVPIALAEVVMRAIARDQADRYPTAETLGMELASAANESFGSGWSVRASFPIMAPGPILSALHHRENAPSSDSESTISSGNPEVRDSFRNGTVADQAAFESRDAPLVSDQSDAEHVNSPRSDDAVPGSNFEAHRSRHRLVWMLPWSSVAIVLLLVGWILAERSNNSATASLGFSYREKTILSDAFDDSSVGWEQSEPSYNDVGGVDSAVIRDGVYRLRVGKANYVQISDTTFPEPAARPELRSLSDVAVEADAVELSDTTAVFGLACRVHDATAYVGVVDGNGFWGVYRASPELFETLTKGQVGGARTGARNHGPLHIRIDCVDGLGGSQTRIRLHVNGAVVADVHGADGSRSGTVGVVVATGPTSGGADVSFDNFVVKELRRN
jgi:serine/threonine protein kinase